MKRARPSESSNDNSSSTDNNNVVQVRTTKEEFLCSIPDFSSIFPNIFLEDGNQSTVADKFNSIKDNVWESKKSFQIRSMIMAEKGREEKRQQDEQGWIGTVSMKPCSLISTDGGIVLAGVLTMNLASDQIEVCQAAGGGAINRIISLKASVVDKNGLMLYEAAGKEQKAFYNKYDKILVRFYVAPLSTLWENDELYFPNDRLRLRITLKTRNADDAAGDELTFLPHAYKCLSDDMLAMFRSGEGADFEIVCKSMKFPVHKTILACRSPVFSRMLATDMKEKTSNSLTVDDIEPRNMKLLLEYIYSSKIELHSLEFEAVLLLGISADKYQVLKLRDQCFNYAADRIDLKTAGQLAVILYKHSAKEGVRGKVFDYCAANWKELCSQEKFQVLVEAHPTAFINKKTS